MIQILKPAAPVVLTTRGPVAVAAFRTLHDESPREYRNGTRHFKFHSDIYAHADVKAALRAAQHDKCAFCESKITATQYGDVEHFRPKGGFRQRESDALKYPGYYWLAYTWENLFLSCQLCNQQFKRNLFPLRWQKQRARSHGHDHTKEVPMLIDPADDPGVDIKFVEERASPRNRSPKGRVTIEALGLNRIELVEERLERIKTLRALRDARRLIVAEPASPRQVAALALLNERVEKAKDSRSPYAAMARAFLA